MDPFPGCCLGLHISALSTFSSIDLSVDDSSFSSATICHPETPIQSEHEQLNKEKIIILSRPARIKCQTIIVAVFCQMCLIIQR